MYLCRIVIIAFAASVALLPCFLQAQWNLSQPAQLPPYVSQQPGVQLGQPVIQFQQPGGQFLQGGNPIVQPGIGLPAPYVAGPQPNIPITQQGFGNGQVSNPYSPYQPIPQYPVAPGQQGGINWNSFGSIAGITPRAGGGTLWKEDVGLDDGYTYLQGFIPVFQSPGQNITFIDARAIKFHEQSEAFGFNFHGGHRWLTQISNRKRIFGAYVGYDFRDTGPYDFHQISFGAESLGPILDFRANGYLLLSSDTRFISVTDLMYTGNNLAGTANYLDAFSGFDIEAGVNLTPGNPGLDVKAFGGGYGFFSDESQDAWGGRARLEATWYKQVSLGASVQHDEVFDTTYNFTLSILFGGANSNQTNPYSGANIAERLGDPLHKNMHVVIGERNQPVTITNPADNMPLEILHIDSNAAAGGTGTFEAPSNTLVANPAANFDIVLVHGGSFFTGQNITIDDSGQRLLGDGTIAPHTTPSQFGTIALPRANALAAQPTIDLAPNPAVTIAANNVEVSGLNITRAVGDGIFGNNVSGVNINRNTISMAGDDGVDLNGVVSGTISNNLVTGGTGAFSDGFEVSNWTAGRISNNTASGNADDGFFFNSVSGGTISGNTSTGNADAGFDIATTFSGGTISGNTAIGNMDDGFEIDGAVSGGIFRGNTSNGNGRSGFFFNTVTGGVFRGNRASTNGIHGFRFGTVSAGTITANTANSNAFDGFRNFTVSGGTISNNTSNGNGFRGFNITTISGGTITGNMASMNSDDGIEIANISGGTLSNNTSTGNTGRGFSLFGTVSGGTISGNTANGNGRDGFFFNNVSGGLIASNMASMNTFDGFDINTSFTGGLFNNNVSNNNGDQGYEITGAVAPASATNNTGVGNAGGNTFSFPP